jgi:hypothetical protein
MGNSVCSLARLLQQASFTSGLFFLQRSENLKALLDVQSSLGKGRPVHVFANLLHHSLSFAFGSNTINLSSRLVGKLVQVLLLNLIAG